MDPSPASPARTLLRHAPRVLIAAAALFSVFLTLQLMWAAFPQVAFRFEAPRLWLTTDVEPRSYWQAIRESRGRRELVTEAERATVRVLAPPDSRLNLLVNGGRHYLRQLPGGVHTADVYLRLGRNDVVVRDAGRADEFDEDRLAFVRRPKEPHYPQVIAWRQLAPSQGLPGGFEWLLLGSPETAYDFSRYYQGDGGEARSDALGLLRAGFSAPPPNQVVDPAQPSGEFRFVDPQFAIERELVVSIDETSIQIDGTVRLNQNYQLRPYLVTAGDVLKQVFGICLQGDGRREASAPADQRLGTMRCWEEPAASTDDPGDRIDFSEADRLKVSRRVAIPDEGLSLEFMPAGVLAGTFLLAPVDRLVVESTGTARGFELEPAGDPTDVSGGTRWSIKRDARTTGTPYGEALRHGPILRISGQRSARVQADGDVDASQTNAARAEDAAARHLRDQLARLEDHIPLRIRAFASQLVSAIPFLYFLWILAAYPSPSPLQHASVRAAILMFLALHLSVAAAGLFETSIRFDSFAVVRDLSPDNPLRRLLELLRQGRGLSPFAGVGIALLAWPVYRALRRAELRPAGTSPRLLRALGWTAFVVMVVAIPAHTIWRLTSYEEQFDVPVERLAIAMGVALIGMGFVLSWLIRVVIGIPVPRRSIHIASWAMVLAPGLPLISDGALSLLRWAVVTELNVYPFMLPERLSNYVAPLIVTALGATLLWRVGGVTVRLAQRRDVHRWWRDKRAPIIAAAVVMSIPVIDFPMTELYGFVALVQDLGRLLPYALLAGVLLLVKCHNTGDRHALSEPEIHLGALVFAWYVSPGNSTVLFIPLPFLMAWFIFRRWLLVSRTADRTSTVERLTAYIDERRARSRLESMQRGLDKKFSEGDLKLADYNARLAEGEAMLAAASARLAAVAPGGADDLFAAGPESGPMANGRIAVLYGMAISAPFQVQTITRMEANGWGGGTFPLLQFGFAVLYSVVTWGAMAAVFGYFYHRIRGRNGFEKALCYSVGVALSSVPLRLVQGQSIMDRALLLNTVQLVAYLLVLALVAFDLRTLQKMKYGWRELMTTYGMASAAYGSTLALTIVSAVGGKDVITAIWTWLTGPS